MIRKRKKQRVAIGIAVSTRRQLIMEARTNIINHSYIMTLDLWELERPDGKKNRLMRVVNIYENNQMADQVLSIVRSNGRRREQADAGQIPSGKTVFFSDFYIYSPQWNEHCGERRDTAGLETLVKIHHVICNNILGRETRPTTGQTTSIIDLRLTTPELSMVDS